MTSMQNLEIQFNTNVIKKVKSLHFQVDQLGSILFILFALYENRIDLLDEFDDYSLQKRAIMLYKDMELKELVEATDSEDDSNFRLSKKGIELVEFIKGEFSKSNENITSEIIAVSGVEQLKDTITSPDEVENWIDEWIDIFPRGIKSGGRLIRGDKMACLRKMKVFIREYDYDKSIIMEATKKYILSKANDNYAYTRCAIYFIYRADGNSRADRISDLASWCEEVLHNRTEGTQNTENNFEFMA